MSWPEHCNFDWWWQWQGSFMGDLFSCVRSRVHNLVDVVAFRESILLHHIDEFTRLKQKYYLVGVGFVEKADIFVQCITHADTVTTLYEASSQNTRIAILQSFPDVSPEYFREEIMDMGLYFLEQSRMMMNDQSFKLPNRQVDFWKNVASHMRVLQALGDKRHDQLISRNPWFELIFPE